MRIIDIITRLRDEHPTSVTAAEGLHIDEVHSRIRAMTEAEAGALLISEGITLETMGDFGFDDEVTAALAAMLHSANN